MFAKDTRWLSARRSLFRSANAYLYKLFIAGLCKLKGAWEKGCFFTRVDGEGARFEGTRLSLLARDPCGRPEGASARASGQLGSDPPGQPRSSSPSGCPAPFAPVLPPTWASGPFSFRLPQCVVTP